MYIIMATEFRNKMRDVMNDAWRMFRITGESFSECLKRAWMLLRLKTQMKTKTVQFFYQKVSGEIRQAFGTLKEEVIDQHVKGTGRKPNDNLQVYWDTEKEEWRCFKKCNLIKIA